MKKALTVALILLAAVVTTYGVHLDYSLPFHSDEWDHLTLGKEIVKTGEADSVRAYNPYLGEPYRVNRGPAYHLLIALLMLHTGLGVTLGTVLPTSIAFALGAGTYALAKHITGSDFAGALSAVFAMTIKSNVTMLGLWFTVPSAYGIAMAPLIMYLFIRTLEKGHLLNQYDISLGLILAQVAFSHPPSATVLFPVMAAYLILHPKTVWKNKKKLAAFAAIGLLLLAIELYIINIPREDILNPMKFVNRHLRFTSEDEDSDIRYFYPKFVGRLTLFLTIVGAYTMLSSDKRGESILPIALLALLPLVYQYYTTGEVYLTTYRRIFLYNVEILLILAGIGLYKLYDITSSTVNRIGDKNIGLPIKAIILAAVLLVTVNQVESTYEYGEKLYHVIEEKDVSPILWLKDNTPENAIVMATPNIAKAITPLADRKIVGIVRTTLRSSEERSDDSWNFFTVDCDSKKNIARKYGVDYVFHNGPLGCDFLEEIHNEKGDYVYKVNA
ncbi:MAG: hypothetical protein V1921_08075 [Candidatus Altiarchaeota archaeon]